MAKLIEGEGLQAEILPTPLSQDDAEEKSIEYQILGENAEMFRRVIQSTEARSGKPSALDINLGGQRFIVGGLKNRVGTFYLHSEAGPRLEDIEGEYTSFAQIEQALKKSNAQRDYPDLAMYTIAGSCLMGYTINLTLMTSELSGVDDVGYIKCPLLDDTSPISVEPFYTK